MKRILRLCIFLLLFPVVVNAKSFSVKAYIEDEAERDIITRIDFVFRADTKSEYSEDSLVTYTLEKSNNYSYLDKNCKYNIKSFVFAKIYMGSTLDSYDIYNVIQNNEQFIDGEGNYVFDFTIQTNPNSHVKTSHLTTTQTSDYDKSTSSLTTSNNGGNVTQSGQTGDKTTNSNTITSKTEVTDEHGNVITTTTMDPILKEKEEQEKKKKEEEEQKKRFDFYLMVWVILALVVLVFILITIVKAIRANKIK